MAEQVLVVFSGLPATGKTTIAKALAQRLAAVYLRADTIEQTLRRWLPDLALTREGYEVAYAVAEENLELGMHVVADSVNPLQITRQAWHEVAQRTHALCVDIEIVCVDQQEHRRRAQSRSTDIPGLALPDWDAVVTRRYEMWDTPRLVVDSAASSPEESVRTILRHLRDNGLFS